MRFTEGAWHVVSFVLGNKEEEEEEGLVVEQLTAPAMFSGASGSSPLLNCSGSVSQSSLKQSHTLGESAVPLSQLLLLLLLHVGEKDGHLCRYHALS